MPHAGPMLYINHYRPLSQHIRFIPFAGMQHTQKPFYTLQHSQISQAKLNSYLQSMKSWIFLNHYSKYKHMTAPISTLSINNPNDAILQHQDTSHGNQHTSQHTSDSKWQSYGMLYDPPLSTYLMRRAHASKDKSMPRLVDKGSDHNQPHVT